MAHQVDKLEKIGKDGFALLDEIYGQNKKSAGSRVPASATQAYDHCNHGHPHHNFNNNRNLKVVRVWEPVIDSNQAAQFYGGMSIVDYSMGKPVCRA